jgi:hypothetical protein
MGTTKAPKVDLADHDLPALRVHRAWEQARLIAKETGTDEGVALRIAQEVIAVVGKGTKRIGCLCPRCHAPIEWKEGRPVCPEHGGLGGLGLGAPLTLAISFDPIDS